ncbi:MAG: cyclopropane-fatty-acyl-phospholipid synthase [Candidatus Parcubacteria bacterium]|jgi:cyclopropane-fatty-acyl-phospholipid synthase|nr:cyclopropane-fatty-acyl-phospholipid synthase [Candidatus Parcubacteria bacterium]
MTLKSRAEVLVARAGIEIDGPNPWDPQVHDERLYGRVIKEGTLGLGEAYMDGWWDVPKLDQFFERVLGADLDEDLTPFQQWLRSTWHKLYNFQSQARAFQVGEQHYDLGNDLYEGMLDKRLVYTCGYWKDSKTLDEAQEAKLDLVCRKLNFKPGDRVLDIGCGWGSFTKYAAEKYGVEAVGITVSKEQAALARELCAGLPVEIRVQDYRDVRERFDHIVSLGMFEHVGRKNYREYMEVARRCLKEDGLFLLHTIGGNRSSSPPDAWMDKYIFPNGVVPSLKEIARAIEGVFIMEDWHNFGSNYDRTLMAWHANFERSWPGLRDKYGDRFKRMWDYYLLQCAGVFRARKNQLWQIVLSPNGVPGGYTPVR